MDDNDKKKEHSSLGKDLDSILGGMTLEDIGVINGRTLTDKANDGSMEADENGVRSAIKELDVEIDFSKEEDVPIHELNIRSSNRKKEKKK